MNEALIRQKFIVKKSQNKPSPQECSRRLLNYYTPG